MRLMLDSDVVNYLLKDRPSVLERYAASVQARHEFILSPFVHYEVTRYLRLKRSHRLMRLYHELIDPWQRHEIAPGDWDLAADLWAERHRAGRPIEDSDLLIAVSALQAGATLVTSNPRHFEGLGVPLENWAA